MLKVYGVQSYKDSMCLDICNNCGCHGQCVPNCNPNCNPVCPYQCSPNTCGTNDCPGNSCTSVTKY
ncbi:MAG: hypothetical protein NTX05_00095 [Fusobacteria bacterium]|nr:hypothetical protein [Fusobacteriota bacterium]